ncbi:uncharacterized protein LOC126682054 [Mercurialis annua]|uniref:uncharacterized protein LOC126682054 n=1 Tax=Mercurialis annua TaxID=3986 RepID=UPI0021601EFC|nr:uncharacterized protein LOC126682054 [Mercurialis annua]
MEELQPQIWNEELVKSGSALKVEATNIRSVCTQPPPQWTPPPANTLKINFDGAFHNASGNGVGAAVTRNQEGRPIATVARRFTHVNSPTLVEALALREAVLLAKSRQLTTVIFEGDAKGIIDAMIEGSNLNPACDVVLHDCRILCSSFSAVSFSFIRRTGNWVAHSLAKKSLKDIPFCTNTLAHLVWLEERLM